MRETSRLSGVVIKNNPGANPLCQRLGRGQWLHAPAIREIMRIKKLKPTDPGYLFRDERKVLVSENKRMRITIGTGIDSLMRHIDNQKHRHENDF